MAYPMHLILRSHLVLFLIPDMVHTMFMADFIWVWLRQLKKHRLDPMVKQFEQLDNIV